MKTPHLETIMDGSDPIAFIVRDQFNEPGIHFFTPPEFSQQLAFMRHPAGKMIAAHAHNPVKRTLLCTQEVLFIRKGRVKITLFSSKRKLLDAVVLTEGDCILLCGGGHALEMLEESRIVEVKQGPCAGTGDKTEF